MSTRSVLVVGAGLSGLACAHELARAGADVRVIEAAPRAGGVVGTIAIDGFRFETGPNTVQASSLEFRRLAHELGLTPRMRVSHPAARERYLWLRGKLHALPGTPAGMLATPLLSLRGKLRLASEILRPFSVTDAEADPDLLTFFSERLGREAAVRLAGAFVRGVYAADLRELGARSAFPRMWAACVRERGLLRAALVGRKAPPPPDMPGPQCSPFDLLSFEDGLGELVDALALELGPRLLVSHAAAGLERSASGWRVLVPHVGELQARHLVLAVPAQAAAQLLAPVPGAQAAAETLKRITHARVTLVHLGLAARDVPALPRGFGFLVPPTDLEPIGAGGASSAAPRALGTIFGSNLFERRAPPEHIAVTSFYKTSDIAAGASAATAQASADLSLALAWKKTPAPVTSKVLCWEGVIPRLASGHQGRMDATLRELEQGAPGLVLAGSYSGGVSVENVIARGRAVARSILAEPA